MADPAKLPRAELERGRDLGAAMYLSSYFHLMARELGVDTDMLGVQGMVIQTTEAMNHATEAIWRALMKDRGMDEALERFKASLEEL